MALHKTKKLFKKKGDTVVQSSGKEMKKSNILMILGKIKYIFVEIIIKKKKRNTKLVVVVGIIKNSEICCHKTNE